MTIINRDAPESGADEQAIAALRQTFDVQKRAFLADPCPSYETRVSRMQEAARMLRDHRKEIGAALNEDFGWHPAAISDLVEIMSTSERVEHAIQHLRAWMMDEPREFNTALWGDAKVVVRPQAKGVIGNMVPWNFPFDIAFAPLGEMFGAGNRVIIKPSDLTPACGALMARMVAERFDPSVLTVVNGGIGLAKAFPTLAWDHLVYTGSPDVAKHVMRAAAENLVPVTLELGGKNPTIVAEDAVDQRSVASIIGAKRFKAGQVCVAPDHVFVPRAQLGRFLDLAKEQCASATPGFVQSDDNTGIISQRHMARLTGMVEQARAAGCEIIDLDAASGGVPSERRQMPLILVIDPPAHLDVMTQEVFGPVLPVVTYDKLDAVLASINAGERPLAVYLYTYDKLLTEDILRRTTSGGACVNAALFHASIVSLPFGGSGNSGMGRHHGVEGFREFSNPRGVLMRSDGPDGLEAFNPPYRVLEAIAASVMTEPS